MLALFQLTVLTFVEHDSLHIISVQVLPEIWVQVADGLPYVIDERFLHRDSAEFDHFLD